MSLSRRNQTKNVVAVFASGVAFTVGISVNMLNIDVLIPNKFQNMTAGLLGNFDGDPTNDIQFKNGTILWGRVGEKDIFNFGKSWAVDPDHSAFWYPQGKGYYDYSHLNYTPIFLEDLDTAKVASARGVCGEKEYECIFDLVLTEDEEVANETRRLGYVARQVDALLENEAPSISGPSTINVTINNTMTYHLSAFDDGSFSYLLLDGQMYANITDQKNGTAVVTLLLQDDRPINVKATVVDEFGAQATPHQLDIVVCSTCNQRGTCDFAEFRDDNRTTDSFKYATCLCDPYWDGPDCEMDRDGCATQPCSPLRKCTDIPADLHQASGVGYNCTDCPDGFTSLNDGRCEDIDECSSSNGGCSQICNNTYGTFSCSCYEGYRKQTGVCQDINECSEASNDCDQICSNSIGGYNCSCYEGFVFNSLTQSCEEGVSPSGCNSLNCSGTAGCTTDTRGNPTCFCPKGYQLSSDGETCDDINECLLPICQHRCTNTEGSFSCSCFNGYSIESDRSSCKECELSKYGENCNNTCKCGQGAIRCDRIKGCICSDGWTGTNCDEDLDECLVPNICNDSFKICLNTKGSYVCNCRDGYVLNTSRSCEDFDECNDPDLNTCQQVCKNEAGGFSCSCFFGYVQSRNSTSVCEDIDECTVGQSGCEQLCHNSEGRFTCDCHFGYILSNDRKTCLKVTDVCVTYGNINCSQICVLEDGQVFCSCVNGYKLSSDNQTCEDINECEDQELNRCSNNCTNHNFGYTCSCANGSQLDNDGRTCKACDAFHYGPNCSYSCNCGVGAERCDPITGCVCSDGWHGNKCDQDINECAQNPCADNNSLCFNTPGSYVCNCLLGYRNVSGVCQDIVECSDPRLNDCNHICLNNIGSYSCSCHEGFVSNGNVCSDIDECIGPHNCSQICINTEGSYLCKCNKGFWLSESDLSTCIPCKANKYGQDCMYDCSCYMPNTQTCDSIDGTCICRKGWESAECSIDIDECSNSSSCDAVNTICINRNGSYSCECRQGYVMDNDAQCKATSPITASATTPTTGSTLTPTTLTSMAEASTTSVTINGETTTTSGNTTSEVTSSTTTSTAENLVTTELKTSSPSLTTTIARTPSTWTPTTDVTLMPHTSISFTTADTTSDSTTISEGKSSQTAVTMTATMSKTSTTLLPATASPSLMTSNSQTSTLTPTAGVTTTTVDTSKTTSSGGTTATSESTTAQTTTSAATTSSEITTTSALISPSLMTSNSKISTLIPTAGATTTTSSSSSVTTVDTSKTTSSGGITATSESITAQTTAPAMTTTSEITTSVMTGSPSSTSSANPTSTLTPTAGSTTSTRSSSSVTTVDTSKTTSIDVTTTKLISSTALTTAPAFTTTYEIPTTSVITTSASLTTSTSSARESTLTNGVTTTPATSMLTVTAATNNTTTVGATTISKYSTSHTSMPTNTTTSQLYTSSTITSTSQIPTSSSSTSTPWASSSSPTSTVSGTSSPSTSAMTSSSNTTTSTKETTTSTSACTNNTFGMNCSLHCNCNISNSKNKSQACDPKNGTCLCNEGWMGVNCSQDVNECEINPEICKEMNNSGCYNVYGSFKCQCHIGYISDGNRTCMEDVPKTTTPMTVNATDSKYKAIITLDLNLQASIDIKVPENYAKVERDVQDALSEFYRTKMDQLFVRVVIVSIRRGSLIVEYFTVTKGSDDALLKLGDANAKLAAGEKISVAGKDSSAVRLNVEGNDLPNDTSADQILCKSYQSLKGACNTDYECILIDNRPTCTPKKKEDNFVLIVAVGTGTSLFVLLLLVIVAVLFYKRKTRQWKTSKELIYRSDSISNRTNQNMATKWHTFDWMKHVSYGFDPSDMLGHSPHPNKQNYYQGNEEGNTENNLSRSLYGDEANSRASKKEFKIKRPKVYGVGNVSYDNGIYN